MDATFEWGSAGLLVLICLVCIVSVVTMRRTIFTLQAAVYRSEALLSILMPTTRALTNGEVIAMLLEQVKSRDETIVKLREELDERISEAQDAEVEITSLNEEVTSLYIENAAASPANDKVVNH